MPGLYIHIPFCKRKCGYCAFSSVSGADYELMRAYAGAIRREMMEKAELAAGLTFDTLFFGGGTPSMLPEDLFSDIVRAARDSFSINETEFSCECNPESAGEALFAAWRQHGVSRVSIGVQSFDDKTLARIGRIHDSAQALNSVEMARKAGFERVSADIICALPGQSFESFLESVKTAAGLGIGHISCYQLEFEDGTPFSSALKAGELSPKGDEDAADEMAAAALALNNAGYARYEVSNFSKPGQECLHNMNYWRRGDYLGLGCAAHSFIGGIRRRNTPDLARYLSGEFEEGFDIITEREAAEETVMLGLRTAEGIDIARLPAKMRENALILAEKGILEINNDRATATSRGMDVLNQAILFVIA